MVIPPKRPDDDDELSYEDFDDAAWVDDELEAIDLDALDADISGEEDDGVPAPAVPDHAAESLLDAIDRLDADLAPAVAVEETPSELAQEEDALPVEAAPAPSEPEPLEAALAPSETPPKVVAAPELGAAVEPAAELALESTPEPAPEIVATAEQTAEPATPPESMSERKAAVEQTGEAETPPEPESVSEAAAEQTAEPATPPEPESVSEAAAEQTEESEAPPEPVIPPEVYCVLLPLPPELASQVIELRKTGEITTMPPPGIVLTPQFRTIHLPAVEAALAKWARAHLPFQFEIVGVSAKVTEAQQYAAAWTLEPEEEIVEAQHALVRALAELILPLPGATMTFSARVPVGEQIAAARFPLVVGQMQRDFEPFVWRTNDLQLVRQGEPPAEWEMIQSFD